MLNKEKLIKDLKLMKNLLPLLKEVKVGFEDLFIGIKYIIKYKVTWCNYIVKLVFFTKNWNNLMKKYLKFRQFKIEKVSY